MSEYKRVEGLARGLKLLGLIGTFESGRARIVDLANASGLHRTTVKRLLETLRSEGYLNYDVNNRYYYLALKARRFADGCVDEAWLVATAMPALMELQSEIIWPTDIATPEGDRMVIRESTRRFSPFALHDTMIGARIPMLYTAAGRAYLGFSSDQVRRAIAMYIARDAGRIGGEHALIQRLGQQAREQGYGANFGEWLKQRRFGGLAVPIQLDDGLVLGCISVVFLNSAVSPSGAVSLFLEPLQRMANRIQAELAESYAMPETRLLSSG